MDTLDSLSAKDAAAAMIRKEIISGRIAGGAELTQNLLAEKLGVSRMPVREALLLLEREGFLERLPNRHMRVVQPKRAELARFCRSLAALESELLVMLIEEGKDTAWIMDAWMRYRQALDLGTGEIECELALHQQISSALDTPFLKRLHRQLTARCLSAASKIEVADRKAALPYFERLLRHLEHGEASPMRACLDGYYATLLGTADAARKE